MQRTASAATIAVGDAGEVKAPRADGHSTTAEDAANSSRGGGSHHGVLWEGAEDGARQGHHHSCQEMGTPFVLLAHTPKECHLMKTSLTTAETEATSETTRLKAAVYSCKLSPSGKGSWQHCGAQGRNGGELPTMICTCFRDGRSHKPTLTHVLCMEPSHWQNRLKCTREGPESAQRWDEANETAQFSEYSKYCTKPCGPTPLANSCNECCVRQCQDSHVAIQPSPVVVTLPGPILSSFPQNTVVGSSTSAAVGSILSCGGVPISSGGFDLSCITNCYGKMVEEEEGSTPLKPTKSSLVTQQPNIISKTMAPVFGNSCEGEKQSLGTAYNLISSFSSSPLPGLQSMACAQEHGSQKGELEQECE
ncbi:hypothetical protein IHE44_0010204 [Lamprotornis superbus]|uniref:Uncharacterized protein n=1 Tax=Lamprotornis superbus TaxID=245042 RepID=A0A835TN53_9PASS|nr:hypothetical protein IHE44_0010204 [Lamprotornis superbus]